MCLLFAWYLLGIYLRFAFDMPEIWLEFARYLLKICLQFSWYLPNIFLLFSWYLPDSICLIIALDLHEIYLRFSCNMPWKCPYQCYIFHLLWQTEWVREWKTGPVPEMLTHLKTMRRSTRVGLCYFLISFLLQVLSK